MTEESKPVKVCVAIPKFGYTYPQSYMNRMVNMCALGKLEARGRYLDESPRFEFYFIVMGDMFTPVAREEAAKYTLECGADYLFMIDDDMICPDDLFERLHKRNVDVIAPLAFTRNPPHHPVLYQSIDDYDPVAKKDWFVNNPVFKYPRNQLVEVDAVGFGAALIKRRVLEGVPRPRFMSTCGTGEDIYFCYQARKHGFRVFSDTAISIGHLGNPICVDEQYVDEYRKTNDPMDAERHRPDYAKYSPTEGLLIQGGR